jgi:hypothetical protein
MLVGTPTSFRDNFRIADNAPGIGLGSLTVNLDFSLAKGLVRIPQFSECFVAGA